MGKLENRNMALINITKYENEKELFEGLGLDDMQEFNDNKESGKYQNLTLGTYNGALDKTTYRDLTEEHMLTAILVETIENEMVIRDLELLGTPNMTDSEKVLFFTETWNVFTYDGMIFYIMD